MGAVGGRDQRGPVRGHEAPHHGAPGLHQLGGDQDVHVAGRGCQREDRSPLTRRCHFEVVDRGPGALRDACHDGGLHPPAVGLGQRDQPARQHPAALAADGEDCELDDLGRAHAPSPNTSRRRSRLRLQPADRRAAEPGGDALAGGPDCARCTLGERRGRAPPPPPPRRNCRSRRSSRRSRPRGRRGADRPAT